MNHLPCVSHRPPPIVRAAGFIMGVATPRLRPLRPVNLALTVIAYLGSVGD